MTKPPKVETWPLAKLRDHPKQAEVFGDLSEPELDALATKMKREGQTQSVEILPDGTVITGHQRVRAARRLGWTKVDVVVRRDLETAGPAAVEDHFITDNLVRRHLTPLAMARCLQRLIEIRTGTKAKHLRWDRKQQLKKEIGRLLNLGERSVNRYLLILETPTAVQNAFDRGKLTLTDAGKVALLDQRVQAEIARRIAAGEEAKPVVAEALRPRANARPKPVAPEVNRLAKELNRALDAIGGQVDKVGPGNVSKHLETFQSFQPLLTELIARASRPRGRFGPLG